MTFEARYHGSCAFGDHINPGDVCTYTEDDEIAHAGCAVEDVIAVASARSTVCGSCSMVHAGECL